MIYLESCFIVIAGVVLLRFSGRKSISQMTIGTTVVMLMIGSILSGPITSHSAWRTIGVVAAAIATLLTIEVLQLKSRTVSRLLSGNSIDLIEQGHVQIENLRKLRMTLDKLHMRLRLAGISDISTVRRATLEANGDLAFDLYDDVKPVTQAQFRKWMDEYMEAFQNTLQETANADHAKHQARIVAKEDFVFQKTEHPRTNDYLH